MIKWLYEYTVHVFNIIKVSKLNNNNNTNQNNQQTEWKRGLAKQGQKAKKNKLYRDR